MVIAYQAMRPRGGEHLQVRQRVEDFGSERNKCSTTSPGSAVFRVLGLRKANRRLRGAFLEQQGHVWREGVCSFWPQEFHRQ